jgi:hypothetical protein
MVKSIPPIKEVLEFIETLVASKHVAHGGAQRSVWWLAFVKSRYTLDRVTQVPRA